MNHYRPHIPPYRPPPPTPTYRPPPPPPPPPPEALQDEAAIGAPRCYFCGQAIAEDAVRKTEYHVGHGHNIFVMICPACQGKKERGEGPFAWTISGATVVSILGVIVFAVFFLGFWLPGFLDMKEKHNNFNKKWDADWKKMEEDHKKFDEDWERRRRGF